MTKQSRRSLGSIGSLGPNGVGFQRSEFGEKDEEEMTEKVSIVMRVLTVVAYIVCVSTAAALLSAYYIFFWVPNPTEPMQRQIRATDSPFSLPQHGNSHYSGGSYHHHYKNSYPSSMDTSKHLPASTRVSKKAYSSKTTPHPNYLPRPQYLGMQMNRPAAPYFK